MALTNKQVQGVCNMFANAFIHAESEEERKKILIDFEDAFSRGIADWKTICGDQIRKLTADKDIIDAYDTLSTRNDDKEKRVDCEIRPLEKEDFEQVREVMNAAFDLMVADHDIAKFEAFVESRYSFVAYKDGEILGAVLAHEQPDLSLPIVYINSFAVTEHARGQGIGRMLFESLRKKVRDNHLLLIKLQTDPKIEAYQIYKHWGMQESELVQMKCYCI